jgi:hypothetical protein
MTLERAIELAEQLSKFKRLATGSSCAPFPRDVIASTDVTFKDAVTAIWGWYEEQLSADVREIASRADPQARPMLSQFSRLLKDQRHVDQHPDYDRAAEARAWRNTVEGQSSGASTETNQLVSALLRELCTALECLCAVAARIARSPSDSQSWRMLAALSPEEEMRAVLANIGRQLQPNRLGYAVRQFDKHPELRGAGSSQARAQVAELVALGVSLAPLSVAYDEILDEFGLVGDARGTALLLLAHGVQASGFHGMRLVPVLREVWEAVQRAGPSS